LGLGFAALAQQFTRVVIGEEPWIRQICLLHLYQR